MRRLTPLAASLAALLLTAAAPDPSERLPDPAQEARARALFQRFRCVVCQNESIDDSEADIAADLRGIIREQVAQGRSDIEIRRFLVDRYGEFVLLEPSFSPGNAILWLTPAVVLLGAGVALFLHGRRRRSGEAPLSDEEEAELARLAGEGSAAIPTNNRQKNTLPDDAKVT
ncbi:MAG TPA: cytochrome c-type biogenesis protein [Caulobacteraceae bacterium]|jgi:cytochrome c-type biogenesis protein CcmH